MCTHIWCFDLKRIFMGTEIKMKRFKKKITSLRIYKYICKYVCWCLQILKINGKT